eukprot:2964-Prymnesium_polylepis.2
MHLDGVADDLVPPDVEEVGFADGGAQLLDELAACALVRHPLVRVELAALSILAAQSRLPVPPREWVVRRLDGRIVAKDVRPAACVGARPAKALLRASAL